MVPRAHIIDQILDYGLPFHIGFVFISISCVADVICTDLVCENNRQAPTGRRVD